ncbi:MAG: D-alanine--D-alanine ligase family protein [Saprospiraceae bacterium]|nr:D-alanine--D-alanine ligase [Saprospiraceae bacterium]MDW8230910.1 D-alanine--D-alanine ligase family protein [Saprospiraceae bacterium]
MKNIAILTGGDSAERVISLRSGQVVYESLPADRYRRFLIDVQGSDWREVSAGVSVDKNDFSISVDGEVIRFDAVFGAIHGSPLEDGKMQGYFDMLGIPYTCCDGFVSALTMNKHLTKQVAAATGVPLAPSVLVRRGEAVDAGAIVSRLGLPLFVKPNTHGSSFGVTKVKTLEALLPAIEAVWPYDREALVEAFLPGREFSNGVFRSGGRVVALPVTEIIPETEFFDFAAKYEGKSQEITPAPLSDSLTEQCQAWSRRLYEALGCRGVVRCDYILVGETFHLLEVNTIPGLSSASIVPQQVRAYGWTLEQFFSQLLEEAISHP